MKVAKYYKNNDVRIEEQERPQVGDKELLVKVMASGICGSDVMEWYRVKKAPLVLGHEIAGIVEEVGKEVSDFNRGDRVTVAHHVPCMTCRYCLYGEFSVCETLRTTNFDPGGFSEFVRIPAINVERGTFKLPEGMSFEVGSFSEPLGCVIRGLKKAGPLEGKSLLVIGSGLSGILHIKIARALGAGFIVATDINKYRLDFAKKVGADLVIDAREDVPNLIEKTFGRKADIVSICVGLDSAIEQGLSSVDRGGSVIFFAPKEPGETYPMPLFELWRDNIRVINTYAAPPADTLMALDLLSSGRVTVDDLITHRFPLALALKGFELTARAGDSMKVIIEPHPK